MSDEREQDVAITHFVNAHMFWYSYTTVKTARFDLEENIAKWVIKNPISNKKYAPKIGDIVLVKHISYEKWVRAKVDDVAEFSASPPKYFLWLLDYGFTLLSDARYIQSIPPEYALVDTKSVYFGGVENIMPCKKEFDFSTLCDKVNDCKEWCDISSQSVKELIADAANITFSISFKSQIGQLFGNLKITDHAGKTIDISDYLIRRGFAIHADGFKEKVLQLKSNKVHRWKINSNDVQLYQNNFNIYGKNKMKGNQNYATRDKDLDDIHCDSATKQKVLNWNHSAKLSSSSVDKHIETVPFIPGGYDNSVLDDDYNNKPLLNIAGGIQKVKEKYKNYIPRPPSESSGHIDISKYSSGKEKQRDKINTSATSSSAFSDNECIQEKDTTKSTSISNSASCSKEEDSILEKYKTTCQNLKESEKSFNVKKNLTFLPAGYDLRNLQPKKKERKPKTLNSELANLKVSRYSNDRRSTHEHFSNINEAW